MYFFAVTFYDENKTFISAPLNSDVDTGSTAFIDAELDIPENAKYVILTLKVGENTIIYFPKTLSGFSKSTVTNKDAFTNGYNEETDEYEWVIDLSDFDGKDIDLE